MPLADFENTCIWTNGAVTVTASFYRTEQGPSPEEDQIRLNEACKVFEKKGKIKKDPLGDPMPYLKDIAAKLSNLMRMEIRDGDAGVRIRQGVRR